ncbi:carotenoid biosynthesis protein [Acidicapsa ligni]|uniref:carotenoid biosynthesis protein n=1 Tax=Acidicapsa ligni TaxID=542300 RepID=UPI0021E0BEED|nr:carotenoid biosynthesis protein [Acidicapsa ligni]
MKRLITALAWVLFAGVMYLILTEAVGPWLRLPGLGNVGFTVVFVLFALVHCVALEGGRRTAVFFGVSAVVSYCMEEFGVRSGVIYGSYHYGESLGAKLGDVPVLIPLAWFMMIYPSWMVGRALLRGIDTRTVTGITALAAVSAFVMTGWDMVMDPGMAKDGNWVWEKGGAYFGVPRHNYLGWLATTFIVYLIAGWLWRGVSDARVNTRLFEALPVMVYGFFAVRYVAENQIPALQLVALFSMGVPALVAGVRVWLGDEGLKNLGAERPHA